MTINFRKFFHAILLCVIWTSAAAQTYPQKDIIVVSTLAAGSTQWNLLNTIGNFMSNNHSKIKFRILEKPGAERMLGANFSAEAAPDGYTIHGGQTSDMVLLPMIKPQGIKYDENSFVPVASLATMPVFLVVPANSPINNFKDYVEAANRSKLKPIVGSTGNLNKLMVARLGQMVDSEMEIIPYNTDAKMLTDLAGGHLPSGILSLLQVRGPAQAGKIKVIACFGKSRSVDFPNVKTINEQYPGLTEAYWWGLYAQKGTSKEVINLLNSEFFTALNNPKLVKELEAIGFDPDPMTLPQVTQFHQSEVKKYRPMVEKYLN